MALTAANFLSAGTTADKKLGGANFLNEKQLSSAIAKQQYVDITDDSEKNNGGFLGGIGYTLGKLGTGAFGILEGIWDYTAGGIAKLFGADEWAEEQFANNIAGKWNQELDDWYNPSDGWRMAGDVASGIGNSLVGVAAVAGAAAITALSGGTLTPVAAGIISSAVIGLGAAGMATTEAYERTGELGGKEFAYGALSGITEAGLEYVSGAAGKVGAKLFAKDTAKTVAKKTILKGIVSNFAGEAFEEAVSEFIEPYYLRWTKVDPNAENATAQQIGYAALVGGISGALMGGIGDVYSTAKSIRRGTKIAQNPQHASSVVEMARSFAEYESKHNTGMEAYQYVSGLVTQYDALDNGTGELTIRQKKLLGQMEAADAVLANADAVLRSKQNIVANAEQFIKAVNERQVIDAATGKPFKFANAQELVNNESLLTQFAVADALGQLMLSKDSVYDLVTSKRSDGIMQADFRNFQKEATAEQKRSVNELFGIDVDSMTYEDFVDKIQGTNKSVFENKKFELQSLSQSKKAVANAVNTNAKIEEISTKTAFSDGLRVYKTKLGKTVAVTKAADGYYVYSDGNISKKLTITELKKVIRALNGVQTTKKQTAKKIAPKQAAPATVTQTANQTESTESAASTETETKTAAETKKTEETAAPQEKHAAKKKKQTKPAAQTEQTGKKTVKKQESAAQTETETKSESKTETDSNTETQNTRKSESTSENKSEPASDAQKKAAPRKKTIEKARESLLKLAQESEQERLHGAFMSNGKQIISDGFFAARYNDVMEALPKSTEEMPKVFETIFDTYKTSDEKRLVNIDADAVRSVAPKRKGDGMTSLARLGDTNFQTRILSSVIDTLQNPIAYVNTQGGNAGTLGVLYIKADNGEAVILPVRSVGGQSSDNITYVSEFGNMTKEEIEALNKKREQAEAERKKRLEKQRAEWDAEQREREESYKKQQAEERAANESKVKTAASDLLSGKKVSNDKVKVYKDASDAYGRETSVFLALFEQYGVKVPVKTKGFINNYMTGIERGTDGSWNYWHKKGHNANTASYFNQLVEAIEKSQPATQEAAATSDAESVKKPVSIEGKTYKDFTVKEFEALPKAAQEYLRIKDKHPNAIILMQLGDFYECFFEDAETASGILDLTLTGRNMGLSERVKMTGLPVKMFTDAQTKLNNSGYDVIKLDSDGTRTIYNAQAVKAASETTKPPPKTAKKETKTASKDAGKIDDFGEKIGGARKDLWKMRGLIASDLESMNIREVKKYTKKEYIWKRPNFVEAVEKGGNRALLYAQNEIYKSLNTQPNFTYQLRDTGAENADAKAQEIAKLYTEEVVAIRKMAEAAKTKEDIASMGTKWLSDNGYVVIKNDGMSYYTDKYYNSPALCSSNYLNVINNLSRRFDSLETRAYREGFGVAADQKLPRGYEIHETQDWQGNGKGEFYIVKGRWIVQKGFKSYEDALAAGLKSIGSAAETKTAGGKKRFIPKQLQNVHRNGLDYRKGKDAAGEDFLHDFGIKGGEFGNWLSETDRRESLNYGYDAFCDMADALDIELTDISLNGTLSIGFGSRGVGNALAHYEPARKVINLTKMNGAGSLAHEWWHAFEDYISGDTHQSTMSSDFSKMPPKTKEAGKALLRAIKYKDAEVSIAEQAESQAKLVARSEKQLTNYLSSEFRWFETEQTSEQKEEIAKKYRWKRAITDADIKRYNELKAKAMAGEENAYIKFISGEKTVFDELNALIKEVTNRSIPKDTKQSIIYYIDDIAKNKAAPAAPKTRTITTQFYTDAKAIGAEYGKSDGYWESDCEMLARAFAAYMDDLTSSQNGYLSGHAKSETAVKDGNSTRVAYLYPHEESERQAIAKAFDALFAAAKEEGLISSATRTKPTTTYKYAVSESADLNSQPAGNKSQKLSPLQMKRAESFARKNIKGYENLTQAEQLEVEWTIASGWRYGVSESEILNLAKISAQIGTGIGFADFKAHTADGKEIAPDGACYMRSGHLTIYLNPNSTSAIETVTLEELTHALEGAEGYSELRKMAEDYYAKHPDEKKRIDDTYRELYKNEQVRYAEEILPSELTAHYIREMLSNRNVLAKMTAEKPSFTKRCIQWLKTFKDKIIGVDNSALDDLQLLENKFISVYNANKGKMAAIQGSVRYNIKSYNKAEHDMEANIRAVSRMNAVTELTGQEFKAGGSTLVSDVMAYYKTLGNNVYNEVLGDVELTRRGIKDSLSHGMGQNKAAAYKAVPQIISDGQIVDYQERWKGHNYDTAVIAAPVKIAGEDYYAAVVVRRTETTQRFYLHEIDIQKRQAVQPESAPTSGAQELGGLPSVNSIFQKLRNVKGSETKFALDMSKRQEKTSAATSINSSKLPAVFSKVQFEAGTKNLDIGGGKFDNATEYLSTKGVKNYIYDPYNRSAEHNQAVAKATENGQSDTVTISNVLNVIDSIAGRKQVLENAVDAVKPDGTVYITVYEGNGSGVARTTGADQFQLNRRLRDYLPEVEAYFDNVVIKNGVIIAKSPIKVTQSLASDIRYALHETKGSDKVMTELPNDTVSLKDVITRKKSLSQLTDQFKGNSRQYTEGFQIAFTNAQAGLERVLKQAGVDNATSLTNYVRAGKYAAFNALDIGGGQFSLDGETRLGDSWGTIWKPIYNMNKADGVAYAKFQEYLLHWHNIDRMAQGKPVFGADVTAADSAAAIAEIEKAYPKFKGIAEKVWRFLDNNLQLSVDSGMYSQEYADNLREMYPHYVPTMREEHTNGTSPIQGKNNIRVNNAKKAAKGADTRILPIDDMVASQTIQKYSAARTNSLLVKLLNASEHEEFRVVSTEDANIDVDTDTLVTTYEDKAKNTHQITFFHNGNRVTVEVSRNLFKGVEAFAPTGDSMFNNAILNGAAKINSTFKKLVTSWNPFFSFFRNPIRDIQEAGLYTRYPLKTFTQNYLRARKEIANNGQYWQEAKAAGITSASVYDYEKGLTYKTESTIKKIGQKLEAASNAIEMTPRMAEYISAREAGLSVQEALLQAQDVTTNFGRGGVFAKKLNATIMPFLNPAIQGFSKMFRAYTGKDAAQSWINLIVRSVLLGIGLTALNDILNGDDDDYENLSDYVKENNYVIALGNGDFLKIPKGRVVSVIGGAYLRSKWYAAGDEDAWEGYLSNIASQVTPVDNFTRTIFSPFTDISTNTTWYGGTIESEKWSGTQPKDRYDETTSSIAIWLGKVFNYSPVKIDYLLDQYGGVVTDIVLPATTLQAEQGIVSQNLLSNSTTNSRWGTEFYSQIEKYTYKKTAGDDAAKGVVKYLNSIKSTLSDMCTQKREIQSDKKLSDSEKTTQVKIIQAAINALQKDSLTNAKYLYEELKKYNLSDDNFDQSYLDAVSVVVGEEFALKSYNKQVYEKAKKLTSFGIGYGTYYDYYFAVKYLTSSEGNTSKKASVIAFTLAQDLPTVQKLVLIMSAGYKIKDGDIKGVSAKQAQRIVAQYITKMQLDKNEKAELAKLCGLTVLNGKIVINA